MIYNDDILAIIPARSGSVGVKDKNIKKLGGFPLLAYSIYAAKESKYISKTIVSTDSEMYATVAEKYGGECPFLRPAKLAGNMSRDIEYLKYTLETINSIEGEVPQGVVLLRPTTPIRDIKDIDLAIELLFKNESKYTSVVSVFEVDECPYKWIKLNDDSIEPLFSDMKLDDINNPRQSFPKSYYPDGYVEVLLSSNILEDGLMYGNNSTYILHGKSIDIDTENDFQVAESYVERTNIYKSMFKLYETN